MVLREGPPATFNWLVWPSTAEMVLLLLNRSSEAEVRLGMVTLTELDQVPQDSPPVEPQPTPARTFGLYMSGANPLEAFGASPAPRDALTTAQNLVKYLGYCGASAVVLPEHLADRSTRRALDAYADEDSTGPDRLDVIRRVLSRQGLSLWLELDFTGPNALPGLPRADSPEAARRGLVRLDRQGRPDGPEYYPLNPEVREAMKRRVVEALTQSQQARARGARQGLLIRLGPGPTLLGTPDTGLDDATFDRFVRRVIQRWRPPAAFPDWERQTRIGSPSVPAIWPAWDACPGLPGVPERLPRFTPSWPRRLRPPPPARFWRSSRPAWMRGPLVPRRGGSIVPDLAPSQAWRSVGLDLQAWPTTPAAPAVFRGVVLSADALGHDLATSPDLDALVAGRADRGLLLTMHDDSPRASRCCPSTGIPDRRGRFVPGEFCFGHRPRRLDSHTPTRCPAEHRPRAAIWVW